MRHHKIKPKFIALLSLLFSLLFAVQPLQAESLYMPIAAADKNTSSQLSPDLTIDLRSAKRNVTLRVGGATFSWCFAPATTGCDNTSPPPTPTINEKGETLRYFGNVEAHYCTGDAGGNCRKDKIESIDIYEDNSVVIVATDAQIGRLRISFCAPVGVSCTREDDNKILLNTRYNGPISELNGQPTWIVGDVQIIELP